MKYFKILLIIGAILGGIVGMAVEIPSYAVSGVIMFAHNDNRLLYFPDTGNLIGADNGYGSAVICKNLLPEKLTMSTIKKIKGTFPGSCIKSKDYSYAKKNFKGIKTSNWIKYDSKLSINTVNGYENTKNLYPFPGSPNSSDVEFYLNKIKMVNVYAKAKRVWKSSNSLTKNYELIFK
jgi:hypothetical protein